MGTDNVAIADECLIGLTTAKDRSMAIAFAWLENEGIPAVPEAAVGKSIRQAIDNLRRRLPKKILTTAGRRIAQDMEKTFRQ